jgi:tetratricopeptide (TPR) repeat protein/transcriptional regulator with XRE-family HTH domain
LCISLHNDRPEKQERKDRMESMELSSFGEMLKTLRKRQRLTQQVLASKLGVHRNTIGIWERGDFLPETKGMVLELAKHLRLSDSETRDLLEASLTGLSPAWHVPYARNPFFTGRGEILETLHQRLAGKQAVALTQSYALHGLGGIGKTHLAIEYTYRHGLSYAAVFWIGAENGEMVLNSFMTIADLLQLPERQEADQQKIVLAVQRWLNTHSQWLLIFDNVEDLTLLQRFLPTTRQGSILITTRRQALGTLAQGIELPQLSPEEGLLLLFRRSKLLSQEATQQQREHFSRQMPREYQAAERLVAMMDGLPLALDQAGAYIEETQCSLADYLELFQTRRAQLLGRRGEVVRDHPASVVATWSLSFEKVERANPAAADLLRLCAFLHPDAIPDEILMQGVTSLDEQAGTADQIPFHEALRTVSAYSLLRRQAEERTCSMHRLVQVVLRDTMDKSTKRVWAERTVQVVNSAFPQADLPTWSQCERCLSQALVCAELVEQEQIKSLEAARLLQSAGAYLADRARFREAYPLLQQALARLEHHLGPEHTDIARTFDRLGRCFELQGKYAEAEPFLVQALSIRERQLGGDHPETAESLNNLAMLYRNQGRYGEAELLFQRALGIDEKVHGETHLDVAIDLNNLAHLYEAQGRYNEAEPLYRRALLIFEQQFRGEHPTIAVILTNLAILCDRQEKYAEGESLVKRAFSISEQQSGPEHVDTGTVLYVQALLYQKQGQYSEAEPLYQRALWIYERQLGPEHPWIGTTLNRLALLSQNQGQDVEAESFFQRALKIREQQLGSDHPDTAQTLNNLAELYRQQGKYEQAEPLYQRALSICEQSLRDDHPLTTEVLSGLAQLCQHQERYEQAEAFYQRALTIREQVLGLDHSKTQQTRDLYNSLLRDMG